VQSACVFSQVAFVLSFAGGRQVIAPDSYTTYHFNLAMSIARKFVRNLSASPI
jgi:hypothetical protein